MKRLLMSLLCALGVTSQLQGETLSEEAFTNRFVEALRADAPDLTITVTGQLQVQVKREGEESTAFLNNAFAEYLRDPSLELEVRNRYT